MNTMNPDNNGTILDSSAIAPTDTAGNPIPVTIPIALAAGIRVVYTTRLGGISGSPWGNCNLGGKSGDDPVVVRANRLAVSHAIGARISLIDQVHSGVAVDIDALDDGALVEPGMPSEDESVSQASYGIDYSGFNGGRSIPADAQVSSQCGIALGIFAADCLPVLLADPIAGIIAAAHCGRRGLQLGVVAASVDMMVSKGARLDHIVATLGPAICGDCYEVGDEIADAFDEQFPGTYTLTRLGGPGIDISKAATQALYEAGIAHDNIVDSMPRMHAATQYLAQDNELSALCASDGEGSPELAQRVDSIRHSTCTLENPLWYSHRRAALAGKTHEGRMLALIVRD